MRKSIILLCILGFTSLIVGSVLAIRPIRASITHSFTISSHGIIVGSDNAEPQETSPATETAPDKIGYSAVLASISFFTIAFLRNRKPAQKPVATNSEFGATAENARPAKDQNSRNSKSS